MSQIKLEDFDGLSVKQLESKLQEVNSIELLTKLEEKENEGGEPRKTALAAINERQGELLEQSTYTAPPPEVESDTPAPPAPPQSEEDPELSDNVQKTEELLQQLEDIAQMNIEKLRECRLEADRILQFSEGHMSIGQDCERPLFLAKAWLGKALHYLGETNPYKEVDNTKEIPKTAEKNEGVDFKVKVRQFGLKNALPAINELRKDLNDLLEAVAEVQDLVHGTEYTCVSNAWNHLSEARFFLGNELSKLRS